MMRENLTASINSNGTITGIALVVSHNHWFLNRICTPIVVFESDFVAKMNLSNWSDYETMMVENSGRSSPRIA